MTSNTSRIGQVACETHSAVANFRGGLGHCCLCAAIDYDARAFPGQRLGNREADAGGAAGNDGQSVIQLKIHRIPRALI